MSLYIYCILVSPNDILYHSVGDELTCHIYYRLFLSSKIGTGKMIGLDKKLPSFHPCRTGMWACN